MPKEIIEDESQLAEPDGDDREARPDDRIEQETDDAEDAESTETDEGKDD